MINIPENTFIGIISDAINGQNDNLMMRIRKIISKIKNDSPSLAIELNKILDAYNQTSLRGLDKPPSPVDSDSRQKLLTEIYPVILNNTPLWDNNISISLENFVLEWESRDKLMEYGLPPSTSLLMDGPPGVGKTITARWLAHQMDLPLLILDLASVMSSFLGKTGNNIRAVLNYARSFPCVLLLDEFDSIAKKRDDNTDVGELKRLVTVLLQAIDEWPHTSVLIAATNHGDLLDPAVWRRFDKVMHFNVPTEELIIQFLENEGVSKRISIHISKRLVGKSFALIERDLTQAKRDVILNKETSSFNFSVLKEFFGISEVNNIIRQLHKDGLSQRAISEDLALSRPAIKKIIEEEEMK